MNVNENIEIPAGILLEHPVLRRQDGGGDPVEVAARVLAALQQHYELRPR